MNSQSVSVPSIFTELSEVGIYRGLCISNSHGVNVPSICTQLSEVSIYRGLCISTALQRHYIEDFMLSSFEGKKEKELLHYNVTIPRTRTLTLSTAQGLTIYRTFKKKKGLTIYRTFNALFSASASW